MQRERADFVQVRLAGGGGNEGVDEALDKAGNNKAEGCTDDDIRTGPLA